MMRYFLFVFLLLCNFTTSNLFASNSLIDSLKIELTKTKIDTSKVKLYHQLSQLISSKEPQIALTYSLEALKLSNKIKWKFGIAQSKHLIGVSNFFMSNYDSSIHHFNNAIVIWDELIISKLNQEKNEGIRGKANSLSNLANNYNAQGIYLRALELYLQALKLKEVIGDQKSISKTLNNIGGLYSNEGDFVNALKYYDKALALAKLLHDQKGVSIRLGNIGNIYAKLKKYDLAIKFYKEALDINLKLGLEEESSSALANLGVTYELQADQLPSSSKYNVEKNKRYQLALRCYLKAQEIDLRHEELNKIAINYENIGSLYYKLGKFKSAEELLFKSLKLGKDLGALEIVRGAHEKLSELFEILKHDELALYHFKNFILFRDSISNEDNQKQQVQLEMNYEFEKKELATKAIQDKKDAIAIAEKNKQNLILVFVVVGLTLVIVFSIFLYKRFKITQKQKMIIEEQKILVDRAYSQLHQKNKEVLDSIHYASKIQSALMTPIKYFEKSLIRLMN